MITDPKRYSVHCKYSEIVSMVLIPRIVEEISAMVKSGSGNSGLLAAQKLSGRQNLIGPVSLVKGSFNGLWKTNQNQYCFILTLYY